ncbi:Membrane fusion component of tripartite multidrug resistance system [Minicystis rosea]|nr:Membrane fusion component of tripartite multidrug resistance system [Minicystis rosea]
MSTTTMTADSRQTTASDQAAAKPKRAPMVMAIIGAVAVLGGGGYYVTHRGLESTDDAQIDAEMVSVPARTGGVVAKIAFVENQVVKAGDVLAELDPEPAKAKLAQAEANLEAARAAADAADADERVAETTVRSNKSAADASLHGAESSVSASRQQIAEGEAAVASATANNQKAQLDLDRAKSLFASGSVAQAEVDRAQTTFDTAAASLSQAKARLASLHASTSQAVSRVAEANARAQQAGEVDALIAQARARARTAHAQVTVAQAARDTAALDLAYTRVVAPQDGVVSKKSIGVGQMIASGQGIVQLVPTRDVWVTGNFKETQIAKMRAGQPAHIEVDALPGLSLHGEVESFSAATGARFSLLPPDNASGNYTKVVQRVPVRVRIKNVPPNVTLRPGLSVDLVVDTTK